VVSERLKTYYSIATQRYSTVPIPNCSLSLPSPSLNTSPPSPALSNITYHTQEQLLTVAEQFTSRPGGLMDAPAGTPAEEEEYE
jgi:hypothetical protein